MSNAKWIESFNRRRREVDLSYYVINAHERGETQLKVCARYGFETLVYFDLDTHTTGSTEDVILMAQVIRQHFPTMPEFVLNSRGGSGWLLVDMSSMTRVEYNALLTRLETYFRSVAASMQLDIEHVEVKGNLYVPTLDEHGRCISVKAGDLLKCPPDETYLVHPAIEATRFASSEFDPWGEPDDIIITLPNDEKIVNEHAGSFRPKLVSDDIAARITQLEQFVNQKFTDRPVKIDRWGISGRQFAEILLTLVILPRNSDGSNPFKRHEKFISVMFETGVFASKYNHHRYKAVRDYLSSIGGIDWIDHTHRPGRDGEKGEACKWALDPMLQTEVEQVLGISCPLPLPLSLYTLVDTRKHRKNVILSENQRYSGQHRTPTMLRLAEILTAQNYAAVEKLFTKVLAA